MGRGEHKGDEADSIFLSVNEIPRDALTPGGFNPETLRHRDFAREQAP